MENPVCPFVNRECTSACRAYMARDGKEFCGVISAWTSITRQFRESNAAYLANSKG